MNHYAYISLLQSKADQIRNLSTALSAAKPFKFGLTIENDVVQIRNGTDNSAKILLCCVYHDHIRMNVWIGPTQNVAADDHYSAMYLDQILDMARAAWHREAYRNVARERQAA